MEMNDICGKILNLIIKLSVRLWCKDVWPID